MFFFITSNQLALPNAPIQFGKFARFSNPVEISNHFCLLGSLITIFFNLIHMIWHTWRIMPLKVDTPIL